MRSGRSTWLRVLALFGALSASGPANAAWSGECPPASPEPRLSTIGSAVEQALAKTPASLAETLASKHVTKSRHIDVPSLIQEGSACGFYAAAMVLGHHGKVSTERAALGAKAMLVDAKHQGFTTDGFISMEDLSRTIRGAGYHTDVTPGATVADLEVSLAKGIPPIVLFVVETDPKSPNYGGPRPTENKDKNQGHYAVIEGVFTDDKGKRWIVAQHGWRSEPYVWSEEAFTKSWGVRQSHMLEIQRPKTENPN